MIDFPTAQSVPDNHITKASKYLRARGIDSPDLIDKLHLRIQPSGSVFTSLYKKGQYGMVNFQRDNRVAIIFPHFNLLGEPITWWSCRLIDAGEASGFARLVKDNRPKMLAPVNEPPHAYLCPLNDWTKLQKGDRVYIHESAIKAINGGLLGYYSIGLNGVAGFSSRKHSLSLVDELKDIPWKQLELQPVIVFDNDYSTNWNVSSAIRILNQKLMSIVGAKPAVHLPLPDPTEERYQGKWGFDDARVFHGNNWARDYLNGTGVEIEGDPLQVALAQLNTEVLVVSDVARIVEQESGVPMTKHSFVDVNYANRVEFIEQNGGGLKRVQVAKEWLMWEHCAKVPTIEYAPGAPRVVPNQYFNSWPGMGIEPYPGEVTPILQLLKNNIMPDTLEWFLNWLAFPLQNLGEKLTTAAVLVGPPGVGKSLLGYFMSRIYGERNAVSIGKEALESSFSSLYGMRQFVVLDEMHHEDRGGATKVLNKLKKLITDPTVVINTKGMPEYSVTNRTNLLITTNYADALKLDDSDRRFAIIKFQPVRNYTQDPEYWEQIVAWAEANLGAFYHWLLERDLTNFDPHGWAPMTEEKHIMTETSRTGMEAWVHELSLNPEQILPGTRCLFTARELATLYFEGQPLSGQGAQQAMGRQLLKSGFKRAGQPPQHVVKFNGTYARYFIIRKRDVNWSNHAQCVEHLSKHAVELGGAKY